MVEARTEAAQKGALLPCAGMENELRGPSGICDI